MLAAKREWLQQLKEAVANLDLTAMHTHLDRANGSGLADGNVVDGVMSTGDVVTVWLTCSSLLIRTGITLRVQLL